MTEAQIRQNLYDTMVINPSVVDGIKNITDKIICHRDIYTIIAHTFPNPGLKWWLIAVIHSMECELDFTKYLGNGQSLNRVTTIVPKGRGPFESFNAGAIDALKLQGADKITDWSLGNVLYFLEGYNGYGYEKYHNMNSPYLWAGSNHYTKGKYTSDGKFDPNAVSTQIGIALLLNKLQI